MSGQRRSDKVGVLLMQLGTPDEPTPGAVRRYLREFLSDPRVIEVPHWRWWFILNFLILPRRSRESAKKYARIWNSTTGSPLAHITQTQARLLEQALPGGFVVQCGMRYGNPSIDRAIDRLVESGAERIVALPMYPQYSAASTGSACDRLFDALGRRRHMPSIRIVPPFFDHPAYIDAQARLVRDAIERLDRPPDKIIFSFHGYPREFVDKGDPYQAHVERTSRLLVAELGLGDSQWMLTYQSRFGRQQWLEPYTEETLVDLARSGVRRVLVASPGFTADCLETIDEIGREVAESFHAAGGESLARCPCLNESPAWIDALRCIVLEESRGWPADGAVRSSENRLDEGSTIIDPDLWKPAARSKG